MNLKIPTIDSQGRSNGFVLPIWSALDHPELRPEQVYLTAIAPGTRKGPHLHMKRRGVFVVLAGEITLVKRTGTATTSVYKTAGTGYTIVPPGTPCALYNFSDKEALVLNLPSPAWSAEDPDEHPVADWVDPAGWPAR